MTYGAIEGKILKEGKCIDFQIPSFKAITLDVETYLVESRGKNNKKVLTQELLAICFYDGVNSYKFYRADYQSSTYMLRACFDKLLRKVYSGYTVYIHNGSSFDLVFLVKYLLSRSNTKLQPTYKDGKFLSLTIRTEYKEINTKDGKEVTKSFSIHIKDSILTL